MILFFRKKTIKKGKRMFVDTNRDAIHEEWYIYKCFRRSKRAASSSKEGALLECVNVGFVGK